MLKKEIEDTGAEMMWLSQKNILEMWRYTNLKTRAAAISIVEF